MMKRFFLILMFVVLAGGLAGYSYYVSTQIPKVAYVDLSKLYNDFEMKKELEGKLSTIQNMRKSILDSLEVNLQVLSGVIERTKGHDQDKVTEFEMKRQEYQMKQQQFSEDTQTLSQQYSDQIWKQLNQYVEDYGKANGYAFIYGVSGTGSLMYGEKGYEITDPVKLYVNEHYKGKAGK